VLDLYQHALCTSVNGFHVSVYDFY
jgi:hypothetical protein